ncbi:MAG: hypothetical protein KQH83_04305 [Actinobacteria bacterium]|nr:hypothetical protein [Actinomycetota bacterium]
MSERRLGTIARLQIQRSAIKHKGVGYDPAPLLAVEEAAIGPHGISGLADGAHVLDVHHAAHPSGRGGGHRTLSMGFTGHYDRIRGRFGEGFPVGVGGENVVVDHEGRLFAGDLSGWVVIRTAGGEIPLTGARVAAPCREFTSYLLGGTGVRDREEIAADLEFLSEGMRGFLLDPGALARPMPVRVGDEVLLRN